MKLHVRGKIQQIYAALLNYNSREHFSFSSLIPK